MDYSGAQWPRGVQHLPFRNWESSKRGMPLLWRGNTPRHAIFECPACTDLRSVAQGASSNVDSQSLIARMLSSEEEWQKYAQMLRSIMVRREERERDEKEKRENT
ncbi:jg22464 [Pararge aegeria aegeria]|uniref:Jg22464 protein n=1 Tax=Pararge aegeria aegeria TaxID=348720 RepID=A0A8S4SA43_9NEOP|nr:jg22464 [Pararge aegeria aegeria]